MLYFFLEFFSWIWGIDEFRLQFIYTSETSSHLHSGFSQFKFLYPLQLLQHYQSQLVIALNRSQRCNMTKLSGGCFVSCRGAQSATSLATRLRCHLPRPPHRWHHHARKHINPRSPSYFVCVFHLCIEARNPLHSASLSISICVCLSGHMPLSIFYIIRFSTHINRLISIIAAMVA